MKKISLITILDVPNYGTYLQALATAIIFQREKTNVEIVHYERPFKNTILLRQHIILRWIKYVYFWLKGYEGILLMPRCRRFLRKYVKITKPYLSYEQLVSNPPKADIYITGSDQVWNSIHNQGIDKAYYLGYAPKGSIKYAYAASIGMESIPENEKEENKILLSSYKAISVREASASALLSQLGISSIHVLDPTLLLTGQEWKKFATKKLVNQPYLLAYSVESKEFDEKVSKIAKAIANKLNLKVVSVSTLGEDKNVPDCDEYFNYATPEVFLSLMANSDFTVASSFHGTAFALNFNKPFVTVSPEAFTSRIDSLLEIVKLECRKINDISQLSDDLVFGEIHYKSVNEIVERERNKSLAFIKKIICGD